MIGSAFALVICLGLSLVPVYLLRGNSAGRARDYLVASERTPTGVVRNGSIAYSLQIVSFGLFFGWGAKGDFWPAFFFAAMFGSGLYLIYRLRGRILGFMARALERDRSVTVAGFIARQHGDDARVQLIAALVSAVAFACMSASVALAVASLLKPVLPAGVDSFAIAAGILVLMLLYAIPAGHSGVMRSAQMLLGIFYISLIGAALIILYLLLSSAGRMPPRGTFAVAALAAGCIIVLFYRRSRYVDTSPRGAPLSGGATAGEPAGAGLSRRVLRVANEVIAFTAATVGVIALIALYSQGISNIPADIISALRIEAPPSLPALLALVLLPALYPIVDTTYWLRMAAFDTEAESVQAEKGRAPESFARMFGMIAGVSALVWLFFCVLGTIAVLGTRTPASTDIFRSFIATLIMQQNEFADAALGLLLTSVIAMTVLTGSAMFSAITAMIRYDVIANVTPAVTQARTRTRAVIAGGVLCFVALVTIGLLHGDADWSLSGGMFLRIQFACACAQLAFAPLVLGPLIGGRSAAIAPAWAIAVIGAGLIAGQGVIIASLQLQFGAWFWAAIPACLGASVFVYAVALLRNRTQSL